MLLESTVDQKNVLSRHGPEKILLLHSRIHLISMEQITPDPSYSPTQNTPCTEYTSIIYTGKQYLVGKDY